MESKADLARGRETAVLQDAAMLMGVLGAWNVARDIDDASEA